MYPRYFFIDEQGEWQEEHSYCWMWGELWPPTKVSGRLAVEVRPDPGVGFTIQQVSVSRDPYNKQQMQELIDALQFCSMYPIYRHKGGPP